MISKEAFFLEDEVTGTLTKTRRELSARWWKDVGLAVSPELQGPLYLCIACNRLEKWKKGD